MFFACGPCSREPRGEMSQKEQKGGEQPAASGIKGGRDGERRVRRRRETTQRARRPISVKNKSKSGETHAGRKDKKAALCVWVSVFLAGSSPREVGSEVGDLRDVAPKWLVSRILDAVESKLTLFSQS